MHTYLSFKISQLRAKNQNAMLTATTVMIAALFTMLLLPRLLVQYVYAGQQLFDPPLLLKHIQLIIFVVGIGPFLVAIVGNALRCKRIKFLEAQLETDDCLDCNHCCDDDKEALVELEELAESLVEGKKAKKTSPKKKKTTAKKVTKRAAKKSLIKNKLVI